MKLSAIWEVFLFYLDLLIHTQQDFTDSIGNPNFNWNNKLRLTTLRSLLDERSILSEQGSIFLEKKLSKQAELSKQAGIFLQCSWAILRNKAFLHLKQKLL